MLCLTWSSRVILLLARHRVIVTGAWQIPFSIILLQKQLLPRQLYSQIKKIIPFSSLTKQTFIGLFSSKYLVATRFRIVWAFLSYYSRGKPR